MFRVFFLITAFVVTTANAQNQTSASQPLGKVGWEPGPTRRGTLTLVWSCLATIITCTWSILHLNVPARGDSAWTKRLRKLKWMCVTILFPEFIFAKAVCELKDAVDNTFEMKRHEIELNWYVEFGRACRVWYRIFHLGNPGRGGTMMGNGPRLDDEPKQDIDSRAVKRERQRLPEFDDRWSKEWTFWTPVHSYFANMGGFDDASVSTIDSLITTSGLLARCRGEPSKSNLFPSKADIEDKGKADLLVKLLAICQILWLVLCVIVRRTTRLPVSPLEIAAVAFSTIAILTYITNLWKPKDVDVPIKLSIPNQYGRVSTDRTALSTARHTLIPFFPFLVKPSGIRFPSTPQSHNSLAVWRASRARISNDSIRKEGSMGMISIITAMSAFVFGSLHCVAWSFEFPSRAEILIWRVGGVASATLPCVALLGSHLLSLLISPRLDRYIQEVHSRLEKIDLYPSIWWDSLDDIWCMSPLRVEFQEFLLTSKTPPTMSTVQTSILTELLRHAQSSTGYNCYNLEEEPRGFMWIEWQLKYVRSCWRHRHIDSEHALEILPALIGLCDEVRALYFGAITSQGIESEKTKAGKIMFFKLCEAFIGHALRAQGHDVPEASLFEILLVEEPCAHWGGIAIVLNWCNALSRALTLVTIFLYAIARVALLVVAFTSLRSVPEDLYVIS